MNREILFRGKRMDNGEWEHGFYVHVPNMRGKEKHFIQTLYESGDLGLIYEVDPATVGQYTGMKDKNGMRIFEGDVLRYDDGDEYDENEWAVVVWMDTGFWLEYHNGQTEPWYELEWAHSHGYFEVIGNIHDNPELMEVQDG